MSIKKLKRNYPVNIRWVHFPLHPRTPPKGQLLEDLFPGRDLTPMKEKMKNLMAQAGLPYGNRTHTYNSRYAQELGKWADTQAGGETIHDSLYKAYFVNNINISDITELIAVAGNAGLDANAARKVLEDREFESEVDEDWRLARKKGITGVPTFYNNDLVVVGCQPYEILERFVMHLIKKQKLNQA